MEYSDAYLREFLPKEDPPPERVPAEVVDELKDWLPTVDLTDADLIARSARWTYAIFSELAEGQYRISRWEPPYGASHPLLFAQGDLQKQCAVGLFDPRQEIPGFGLILTMPQWPGPNFYVVAYLEFPRLKQTFPLAIRHAEIELHAPPHPTGATSACWAQCRATKNWGIITAGHAVPDRRPGRSVPLAAGGAGSLVRTYYQPIDAAFVHVSPPSAKPSALPTLSFPAAGQSVTVETQRGSQSRTIVGVMDSLGVLTTREFAVLLHLDQPCQAGDSGSLVRMSTGEAVGIYKARMKTSHTQYPIVGLVQNFEQAIYALDVAPFN